MTITWKGQAITERVRQAIMASVVRGTESVRNEAISLILNTKKTGRVYPHRGVEHIASAPGEPPASDTGRLVNSIQTVYDTTNLTGTVKVSVEYGAYLEFGTQTIEPRPFMRPALANRQAAIEADLATTIRRELG